METEGVIAASASLGGVGNGGGAYSSSSYRGLPEQQAPAAAIWKR